jgi:hypothetical protein
MSEQVTQPSHVHAWKDMGGTVGIPWLHICKGCGLTGDRSMWARLEALEALARQVAAPGAAQAILTDLTTGEPMPPICTFCYHRPSEHAADCPVLVARALVGDQFAGTMIHEDQPAQEPQP